MARTTPGRPGRPGSRTAPDAPETPDTPAVPDTGEGSDTATGSAVTGDDGATDGPADTPAPDATTPDTTPDTDPDAATAESGPTDTPGTDAEDPPDTDSENLPDTDSGDGQDTPEGAALQGIEPLLGLMVGDAPTQTEKNIAGPVWVMLTQTPGRTANQMTADLELAGMAGVESPTVAGVLTRWKTSGIAIADTDDNGITRWSPGNTGTVMAAFEALRPGMSGGSGPRRGRTSACSTSATVTPTDSYWPQGGLQEWVETYINDHPNEIVTPGSIAREIDAWKGNNQSSGAVLNTLRSLADSGRAFLVSAKPWSFQSILGGA